MKKKSRKIYIGKSRLHGRGLFTLKNIKKGEVVFFIKGKKIDFLISNKTKAKIAGLNWVGIGKNEWLDPKTEYGHYFNHSCNPNTAVKGKVTVIALRDIKKNEEITFDYSTTEGDIFWSMKCCCEEKNCRKTIRSIQFLPKKTFHEYEFYIPKFFQKVYKKFNIFKFKSFENLQIKWIDFIKKSFSI